MRCFNGVLRVLVFRHGWIVVHLQALCAILPNLFHLLLSIVAAFATFTAAATAPATQAQRGRHRHVPRCHGVQRSWQEVPSAQDFGQEAWAAGLHDIYNDHKDDQCNDGHANANQNLPTGQRQAKDAEGQHQEAQEEVEGSEPTVFGGMVPQASGQPDGHPHEGDGIPQ